VTARERRVVILGASAVAFTVLGLRVLPWSVRRIRDADGEVRQAALLVARGRAELASAAAVEDSGVTLAHALATMAPRLLSGTTAAEAGADLSNDLTLFATRHSVLVQRIEQGAESSVAGRLGRVTLRVEVESDLRGITELLVALARAPAAIVVDDIRLVARDPASGDDRPETLTGELQIAGWYLRPPAVAHAASGPGQ